MTNVTSVGVYSIGTGSFKHWNEAMKFFLKVLLT